MSKDDIARVRRYAESCLGDMGHTDQVTYLALRLFDETTALHNLDARARGLLECGALLHDIGWVHGWKGHHKSSLEMILESGQLPFDEKLRLLVGSIARYHRKALPSVDHDHYSALSTAEQRIVSQLAAILRIADGLDRTHTNAVSDLHCEIKREEVIIYCATKSAAGQEEKYATGKADLFTVVYNKTATIRMQAG